MTTTKPPKTEPLPEETVSRVRNLLSESHALERDYRKTRQWLQKEIQTREERMTQQLLGSADLLWEAFLPLFSARTGIDAKRPEGGIRKHDIHWRRNYICNHEIPKLQKEAIAKGDKEMRKFLFEMSFLFMSKALWNGADNDGDSFLRKTRMLREKIKELLEENVQQTKG